MMCNRFCPLVFLLALLSTPAPAATHQSDHFTVEAETEAIAKQVAETAEKLLEKIARDWLGEESSVIGSGWVAEPRATWERWHAAGADAAVVTARTTADVDALVESVARW